MNATTIVSRIAGLSLGLLVAGAVLGQTGTAFADAPGSPVAPPAASPVVSSPVSGWAWLTDLAPWFPAQPAQDLTVSGSANAVVVSGEVSCTRLADAAYSWQLTTEVDGVPLDITFNTNHYRGAATYRATGVTDDDGGLMTLGTGDVQVATNGFSTGTFTVDDGEATGSVDAVLDDAATDQLVHVAGTWTCS